MALRELQYSMHDKMGVAEGIYYGVAYMYYAATPQFTLKVSPTQLADHKKCGV